MGRYDRRGRASRAGTARRAGPRRGVGRPGSAGPRVRGDHVRELRDVSRSARPSSAAATARGHDEPGTGAGSGPPLVAKTDARQERAHPTTSARPGARPARQNDHTSSVDHACQTIDAEEAIPPEVIDRPVAPPRRGHGRRSAGHLHPIPEVTSPATTSAPSAHPRRCRSEHRPLAAAVLRHRDHGPVGHRTEHRLRTSEPDCIDRGVPDSSPAPECERFQAGLMLMLRWKTLPGSYSALIRASRSYLAPYAARTRCSSCSVMPLT